jgi:hypothetical protein
MITRRRMEVTIETETRVSVRPDPRADSSCWCGGLLLTPESAAQMSLTSVREIYRLIEAGAVHFTNEREPRVCTRSAGLVT